MGLTASTTSVAGQSMTSENVHVKSACTGEAGAEATVPEEELQIVRDALFPHDLRVQRTLGAGSFGSVHAAYCDQTQNDVAVKVIDFSPDDLEEDRRAFRLEVSAMKALGDSDFIVSHERSWMNADKSGGYIVMELVDGQDLEEYLDQYGHRIGQTDAKRIGLRIAKALRDMHRAGWVHRDVKCGNVLMFTESLSDDNGDIFSAVKLADLGLVATVGSKVEQVAGTLDFMPNNLVSSWEHETKPPPPRPSDDMFAFACVMMEVMGAGYVLDHWNKTRRRRIKDGKSVERLRFPEDIAEKFHIRLIDALEACWDDDRRKRPTAVEMVSLLEELIEQQSDTKSQASILTDADDDNEEDDSTSIDIADQNEAGCIAERLKKRRRHD